MRISVFTVFAVAMVFAATDGSLAQTRVRTETVRPPAAAPRPGLPPSPSASPAVTGTVPPRKPADRTQIPPPATAAVPEILRDPALLPAPVARMRERILAAARSGDLQQVITVMQSNEMMPIFSLNDDKNPIAYWRATFPDSGGVEILSIIIEILESGFIRAEAGTPQEMYLWPYFARLPLTALSPAQRVELFKIVTGSDYKEMLEVGAYNFYRIGIGPDGTWHFLVDGD